MVFVKYEQMFYNLPGIRPYTIRLCAEQIGVFVKTLHRWDRETCA